MRLAGNPSAPTAKVLYAIALALSALVAAFVALEAGGFQRELHPDPTRGAYTWLFAALASCISFAAVAGFLVMCRWLLWPKHRNHQWNLHAGTYLVLLLFTSVAYSSVFIYLAYWPRLEKDWVVDYGNPLPEGLAPAYFPLEYERFEMAGQINSNGRFREFAEEDGTAYRREGFVGHVGQVSKRSYSSAKNARLAVHELAAAAERDGYRRTVGLTRVRPNPSIERTSPGKPGAASHLKR